MNFENSIGVFQKFYILTLVTFIEIYSKIFFDEVQCEDQQGVQ